ncbi:ferric-chelate reductase Frp1 [Tritrichomonas musculus]|uniref:Ferric-chelate reductase Frp1 n=1 Tax=Tritrichomonas musculus TaxID=1915356 RepID=A0ABR2JH43_9EUKA
MGNQESKYADEIENREDGPISDEQMNEFIENTQFNPKDIQQLLLAYRKIGGSISGDGLISEEEFKKNIKFSNDKIADKIYRMIDVDGDRNIQFSEFVYGLNIFMPGSDFETKIQKCFNAYDEDGSGGISKNEILEIIGMSLDGNHFINMDMPHLIHLVDELFELCDSSGDEEGNMSLVDFKKMVKEAPGILDVFAFDLSMLPAFNEMKN